MFEEYKNKIGYYLFKKKLFKEIDNSQSFNNFIENSNSVILVLPLNESDFANSFDVAKYFKIHKKEVTVFIPEFKVNSMDITRNFQYISYDLNDVNKLGLPSKQLIDKLSEKEFDVLVDLEREDNLFLLSVSSQIKAKFKVGFRKVSVDNLYNFQLVNTKINSEISYRNLLNSLKMF